MGWKGAINPRSKFFPRIPYQRWGGRGMIFRGRNMIRQKNNISKKPSKPRTIKCYRLPHSHRHIYMSKANRKGLKMSVIVSPRFEIIIIPLGDAKKGDYIAQSKARYIRTHNTKIQSFFAPKKKLKKLVLIYVFHSNQMGKSCVIDRYKIKKLFPSYVFLSSHCFIFCFSRFKVVTHFNPPHPVYCFISSRFVIPRQQNFCFSPRTILLFMGGFWRLLGNFFGRAQNVLPGWICTAVHFVHIYGEFLNIQMEERGKRCIFSFWRQFL